MPGLGIDVAALVGDIGTTAVVIRTYLTSAINVFGEATALFDDSDAQLVIHPASVRQKLALPEGDRTRDTIAWYSTAPIAGAGTTRPAEIQYPATTGPWYQVQDVADFGEGGGIYFGTATRIEGS